MARVKSSSGDELRAILCLAFTAESSLDQVKAFEQFLIERPEVLHAAEVEGSFDFLFEAAFTDLNHFHHFSETMAKSFSAILHKKKVSFVCRRFIAGDDRAVWVHMNGKRVRVDLNRVEQVVAEGDYVRLHVDGHVYLLHATMRAMEEALDPDRFIRVHRSTILRVATIELLRRDGRHWVAKSRDGSIHRIAKAHVAPLLDRLDSLSSTYGRFSSPLPALSESAALVHDE